MGIYTKGIGYIQMRDYTCIEVIRLNYNKQMVYPLRFESVSSDFFLENVFVHFHL